jgi:hypothetical protein
MELEGLIMPKKGDGPAEPTILRLPKGEKSRGHRLRSKGKEVGTRKDFASQIARFPEAERVVLNQAQKDFEAVWQSLYWAAKSVPALGSVGVTNLSIELALAELVEMQKRVEEVLGECLRALGVEWDPSQQRKTLVMRTPDSTLADLYKQLGQAYARIAELEKRRGK